MWVAIKPKEFAESLSPATLLGRIWKREMNWYLINTNTTLLG